jgi:hypothetical protein
MPAGCHHPADAQRLLELYAFRFQDGAESLQIGLPRNARRSLGAAITSSAMMDSIERLRPAR